MIKLSDRLYTVAALAGSGGSVVDVGTDHGHVPVYFAKNGLFGRIAASDIKRGPLNSAAASAREYGVEDRIEFYLSDGLRGVPGSFETVIISGMGGETMVSILDACPWICSSRLVLQPQSKFRELLAWLDGHGFICEKAGLSEDAGKIYAAFRAVQGRGRFDLIAALTAERDPLLAKSLEREKTRLCRALRGLEQGGLKGGGEYERLRGELGIVEKTYAEVLKW